MSNEKDELLFCLLSFFYDEMLFRVLEKRKDKDFHRQSLMNLQEKDMAKIMDHIKNLTNVPFKDLILKYGEELNVTTK